MGCTNPTITCPAGCVTVDSRNKFTDTGIDVVAGRIYGYTVSGEWCDWFKQCDANGYEGEANKKPLERFLRVPGAKWFQLVGLIDKEHPVIFQNGQFKAEISGRLFCFPNDLGFMRWNNKGCVCLTIKEV
jgi:hypothetical protein